MRSQSQFIKLVTQASPMPRPPMRASASSMCSAFHSIELGLIVLDFCAHDAQVSSGLRLIKTSNRVMSVASSEQEESHRREKEVRVTVLMQRSPYLLVMSLS